MHYAAACCRFSSQARLMALPLALFWLLLQAVPAAAQTVIGGQTPDSSAMLELRSTSRGFLLPRLTTQQRDAISKPQTGLMVFNTTLNCVEVNLGTTTAPDWTCIATGSAPPPAPACRAKVNATDYKEFLCHNLGSANTSADPFTPSWEIVGGYWQWGRKGPDPGQWTNTNTPNFAHGPTGPGAGETNEAAITGWDQTNAPNGAWLDASKTTNDPCPSGFRVPTKAQWDAVNSNNTKSYIGTWSDEATNYNSGILYGMELFLPAAGLRFLNGGNLVDRGGFGYYWCSTESNEANEAWVHAFEDNDFYIYDTPRSYGLTLRCIAEDAPPAAGSIGALNCNSATPAGTLTAGSAASGVSASVPYTGGNGGTHSGQVVTSTGVTGLTATLAAGSFANGAGNLNYAITGTPSGAGTASFALNIGGQTCTLALTVLPLCRAKVNATDYKTFMCHNLGAANTSADPFTPSWEIIGGYWQWGRKGPDPGQWTNTNTPNFAHGPTGSGAGQTNEAAITGWDQTNAPNGAWLDASKSANDPCPQGFRVPTKDQWIGMMNAANNPQTVIGTWPNSPTNYSSGRKFGEELMLPAAGNRSLDVGQLLYRGYVGGYWSSTEYGTVDAWYLDFYSGDADTFYYFRRYGQSLRCIAE